MSRFFYKHRKSRYFTSEIPLGRPTLLLPVSSIHAIPPAPILSWLYECAAIACLFPELAPPSRQRPRRMHAGIVVTIGAFLADLCAPSKAMSPDPIQLIAVITHSRPTPSELECLLPPASLPAFHISGAPAHACGIRHHNAAKPHSAAGTLMVHPPWSA